MSKKILNTTGISNELAGASLFFSSPKQKEEAQPLSTIPVQAPVMPVKTIADIPTTIPSFQTPRASQDHSNQPEVGEINPTPIPTDSATPSSDMEFQPSQPSGRTPVRSGTSTSGRRTITRYAFEFFQDQIASLRRFALEEKLRDEKGSMSEMVREAIDAYIARRNRTDG